MADPFAGITPDMLKSAKSLAPASTGHKCSEVPKFAKGDFVNWVEVDKNFKPKTQDEWREAQAGTAHYTTRTGTVTKVNCSYTFEVDTAQ